ISATVMMFSAIPCPRRRALLRRVILGIRMGDDARRRQGPAWVNVGGPAASGRLSEQQRQLGGDLLQLSRRQALVAEADGALPVDQNLRWQRRDLQRRAGRSPFRINA